MKATIYHNSRCSKSRETLKLLEENNITPDIVYYLESPPSKEILMELLSLLDKHPTEIIRFKELPAVEKKLSKIDDRSIDEWLGLMTANPILIERPIVVIGNKAVVGRPPENVLSII